VRNNSRLVMAILFVLAIVTLMFASIGSGGRIQNQNNASPRLECEQACTRDYQNCRKAANANQAQCKQAMDDCKAGCKNPATPTPTEVPTATPTP
jgi:hypothetical protein